jgi:hypothetical protein
MPDIQRLMYSKCQIYCSKGVVAINNRFISDTQIPDGVPAVQYTGTVENGFFNDAPACRAVAYLSHSFGIHIIDPVRRVAVEVLFCEDGIGTDGS